MDPARMSAMESGVSVSAALAAVCSPGCAQAAVDVRKRPARRLRRLKRKRGQGAHGRGHARSPVSGAGDAGRWAGACPSGRSGEVNPARHGADQDVGLCRSGGIRVRILLWLLLKKVSSCMWSCCRERRGAIVLLPCRWVVERSSGRLNCFSAEWFAGSRGGGVPPEERIQRRHY